MVQTLNITCPSRCYRWILRFSYRLLLQYFCLSTEFTWCSASNSLQPRKTVGIVTMLWA